MQNLNKDRKNGRQVCKPWMSSETETNGNTVLFFITLSIRSSHACPLVTIRNFKFAWTNRRPNCCVTFSLTVYLSPRELYEHFRTLNNFFPSLDVETWKLIASDADFYKVPSYETLFVSSSECHAVIRYDVVEAVEPCRRMAPSKNKDSHLSPCMSPYWGFSGVSKEQFERNSVPPVFQVVATRTWRWSYFRRKSSPMWSCLKRTCKRRICIRCLTRSSTCE